MQQPKPALAGITVLDLGTMVTAPYAAMLLAQLGADVIKVEHPNGGDPFRRTTGNDYSPNFVGYNQNKKSVQLDLTLDADRARLLKLVARADVLVENFRTGVMIKLGLSQAELARHNPRLIHCSISGFGPDGPYAQRPAYDTVGTALSGLLSLFMDPERPQVIGPTLADNVTGLFATNGILAALHARETTRRGQRVEVNMLECAIALMPDAFAYQTRLGVTHDRLSRAASSQCFAFLCQDGAAIAVHLSVQEKFWLGFLDALGARDTIGRDERFGTRKQRLDHYVVLQDALAQIVRGKPRQHWADEFIKHDVPFAPVNGIADVLKDPQVMHLGTFASAEHLKHGITTGIRSPVRINGQRQPVLPPPALGEHTSEVLDTLDEAKSNP